VESKDGIVFEDIPASHSLISKEGVVESKEPNNDVSLTSSTVIPKGQDVLISWKTNNPEILGYEICVGTVAGRWDQLVSQLGKDVRAIKLPDLSPDITKLFIEFCYSIPSNTTHHHESSETVLLHEAWEISRV
jgi:hypothetical protein